MRGAIIIFKFIEMKGFLILICLLSIVFSGDIITFDIKTDYTNVGKMTTLSFKFVLMNPNTIYDYLRIDMPSGFNTNYSSNDYEPIGDWAIQASSCDSLNFDATQVIIGKQLNNSLIMIFTTNGAPTALTAHTNYTLRLKNINSYVIPSGLYTPFTMYSTPVSDVSIQDFYRYDQNLFAGMLELTTAPKTGGLTVTVTNVDGTTNLGYVSQVSRLRFSITASVVVISNARIRLRFQEQFLSFIADSCILEGNTYPNSSLTFTLETEYLQVTLNETLNGTLNFHCNIQNSNFAATDSLSIYTLLGSADTIVEEANFSSSLLTVQALNWDPNGFKVSIGWDYDIGNSSRLPVPMRFYRSTATNPVYNTVWFYFKSSNNTSSSTSNIVTLELVNDAALSILKSSITTTLPPSITSMPSCTVSSTKSIVCSNVGAISCTTCLFSIAFRFAYVSGTDLTLPSGFGRISMTSSSGYDIILPSKYTLPTQFETIVANLALYTPVNNISSDVFTGNTVVHTLLPDTFVSNTNFSLISDINEYSLLFTHLIQKSWVTGSSFAVGDGIEYFTSPQVAPSSPVTCSIVGKSVTFTTCEAVQSYYGNSNLTRFRASPDIATASSMFPTSSSTIDLNFNTVIVNKVSGLKIVDDSIYDFYGRTVAAALTSDQGEFISTASTYNFLINSYAVSAESFSSINVSLSSVWNNGTNNLGSLFPTVVTMRGQFTDDEADTVKILNVFFTGLKPFEYSGNYSCGFSNDIPLNCRYFDEGLNPFNPLLSARVEIDFSNALNYATRNQYTLAFPVYSPDSISDFVLGVSTASSTMIGNDYTPSHLKFYNFLHVVVNETLPIVRPSNLILIPVGITFGQEDITGTTSLPMNFIISGTYQTNLGAGIQVCTKWNGFTSSSFRAIFPSTGTGISTICAKYNYTYDSVTNFCAHCPYEFDADTTTKDIRLQSLVYPGYILPYPNDFLVVYSDATSAAVAYKNDTFSTRLNPNSDVVLNAFLSNPANLTYNSRLNKFSVAFTPASPIPPNPSFKVIINTGNQFNVTLVPLSTQCSIILGADEQLCEVTGTSVFTVTKIPSYYVGTQSQIQINIDGINIDSTNINTTITSTFLIQIMSNNNLVQQNWEFQNGTFEIYPSSSPYGAVSEIIFNGVYFVFPIAGFPSRLTINFKVPKSPDNSINSYFIKLPFEIKSNDLSTYCHIIETFGMSLSFLTCNLVNTTFVELVGLSPNLIQKGYDYTVYLDHVVVPPSSPSTAMEISHYVNGTIISFGTKVIDFNITTPIQSLDITFEKRYNNPGDSLELQFQFRTPIVANYLTQFVIHFPYYYAETVITKHLSCLIESVKMPCYVYDERTLVIQGSLLQLEIGDPITILIYGIIQPYTTKVGNFSVSINNGSYAYPFDFVGHVTDILPQYHFSSFAPTNLTLSTTSLRAPADMIIFFNLSIQVDSNQWIMTVPLPHSFTYDVYNQDTSVQCTLQSYGNPSYLFLPFCERLASRVKISLSEVIPKNVLYRLILRNLLNPDLEICDPNKIAISFAYSNQSFIFATTVPNTINMPNYNYKATNDTKQFNIFNYDPATGGIAPISKENIFTLTRGTLSLPIQIFSQDGQFFVGDTQFYVNQLYFGSVSGTLYKRDIIVSQGYSTAKILIGCETNTVLSKYEVKIGKGEFTTRSFAEPPRLSIQVVTTPIVLTVQNTYRIPQGGFSLPIFFNFRNYLPYEFVGVKVTLIDRASEFLSVVTNSEIQFSRLSQIGYLQLKADSAVDLGASYTISLSLTGRNAASYVFSNPLITIDFFSQSTDTPILKIISPEIVNATTQLINIVADHAGTMYYAVYINQTMFPTCEQIYKQAIQLPVFNLSDASQIQYGIAFVPTENIMTSFTVFNLQATGTYMIAGCLQTQMNQWSTLVRKGFTMADNNSTIFRVNITYNNTVPSTKDEESFLCQLTQYFQMPKNMIVSEYGIYCGYNTTALSNWTYSRIKIPYEEPSYNSITYFVYSDRSQEAADIRPTTLQNEISNFKDTKTALGAKLFAFQNSTKSFPGVTSINVLANIPSDPPNFSGTISVGSGNNWVSIQNISIDDTGFLLFGCRRGYIPTYYEILNDYNKNVTVNSSYLNFGGKMSASQAISYNFTNLTQNSTYYLAIFSKGFDDSYLSNPSEPLIITLETTEQPVLTVLSSRNLYVPVMLIMLFLYLI